MLRLALRPASARCRVRLLSSGRTSGPGVPGGRGVQGPAGPNVRSGGGSGGGGSGGGGSGSGGSGSGGGGSSGSGGHAAGVADSAAGHWGFSSPRASAASADHVRHVVSERLHVLSDTISASVSQQQREEMERLFKQTLNERSRAVAAALCGALIVFGGIAFTNRQRAREIVVEELSQAASGTLGDEKMQMQATALTLQTLRALLQDEVTQQRSVSFVAALAEHPTTRAALLSLLVSALKDEAVLKEALQLTLWVLGRDDTRDVVITALIAALTSEAFLEAAGEFAVRWLERPEVREAVSEVLQSSSMAVLDNEEVRGEARQLVQALLEQPHLQAKTGEHLWAAMKGGIFGLGYKKSTEPVPAAAAHPEVAAATEKLSKPPPLAPPGEAEAEGSAGARAAGEAGAPLEGDAPLMRELQLVRHASEARQASARRSEGET